MLLPCLLLAACMRSGYGARDARPADRPAPDRDATADATADVVVDAAPADRAQDLAAVDHDPARVCPHAPPWWDEAFAARRRLSFESLAPAVDLVDFPVLLRLDLAQYAGGELGPAGAALRFVHGSAVLAHELERWDPAAGIADVWINFPRLRATGERAVWVYFANPAAADGQRPADVWSNGYVGVWHMARATGGAVLDSLGVRHGEPAGSPTAPAGVAGAALGVDGATQHVRVPGLAADAQRLGGPLTVEGWARTATVCPQFCTILGRQLGSESLDSYSLTLQGDWAPNVPRLSVNGTNANGAAAAALGVWHHVAGTYDGQLLRLFFDGAEVASTPYADGIPIDDNDTVFGAEENATGDTVTERFTGELDELRISDTVRSAAWLAIQVQNVHELAGQTTPAGPIERCAP